MQIEVRKAEMGKEKKRLKVCAYARVSTEASEQENSLYRDDSGQSCL